MVKSIFLTLTLLISQAALAEKNIDPSQSLINWKGTKLTGQHVGTVRIKSGSFDIDKQQAEVVVDMDSIDVTDLEGEWKGKLMNHLRSEDFFSVDKYKIANLKINKMDRKKDGVYMASGTLTIKEKTQPVSFEVKASKGVYTGELTFDRTQFDIKYNSGKFFEKLGDKLIHDQVSLTFKIATK